MADCLHHPLTSSPRSKVQVLYHPHPTPNPTHDITDIDRTTCSAPLGQSTPTSAGARKQGEETRAENLEGAPPISPPPSSYFPPPSSYFSPSLPVFARRTINILLSSQEMSRRLFQPVQMMLQPPVGIFPGKVPPHLFPSGGPYYQQNTSA